MSSDDRAVAGSIKSYLAVAKQNHPDLNLKWGFALVPYSIDEEHDWPRDQPSRHLDYIGAVSLKGTRLPLTQSLTDEMDKICWMQGIVASALLVPAALELLDDHAPLPYLGLSLMAGPTLPVGGTSKHRRVPLSVHLEPEDLSSPIIMLTTERPMSWPP